MCGVTRDALYELNLQHKEHLVVFSENWGLNVLKTGPSFESRGVAAAAAQLRSATLNLDVLLLR